MRMVNRFLILLVALLTVASMLSLGKASQIRGMESPQSSLFQGNFLTYLPFLAKSYGYTNAIQPFGVQIGDLADATALRLSQEVGASWVRVGVSWSRLEPANLTQENFNWSLYDAGFAAAAGRGLTLLVTISDNPSWAAETTCGPITSALLKDFASFLQALVARYSKPPYNAHYWELYNEPDNTNTQNNIYVDRSWLGGCWGWKGKEYGEMLKVAYPAIKAADPQAKVVLGSLAHDWFTTEGGPFDERFLDDVLDPAKGNAGAYFDLLGFHYYPAFRDRWEQYGKDVIGKANYLKDTAAKYGVDKPMMVTEIGMWSAHGDGNEEVQGDYVVQAFTRGMVANLRSLIWFTLVDGSGSGDWGYGLLKVDLSTKPAYTAYRAVSDLLRGATFKGPMPGLPSSMEGYVFIMLDGKERCVLWSTQDGATALAFAGSRATVTDKYGRATEYTDGSDGSWDGRVTISVTKSPIYLDVTQ